MPRSTNASQLSGYFIAYDNDNVDPQLPPKIVQESIPNLFRIFSISDTKSHVVLWLISA